ncbi:Fe-S cluster assembly protein SufD [Thermosynechococcus sp. JY1334]|uniref:Fe-S cluster assembly protein SufD n=1 Tax=unclassified Thermosynechococcus TaxID=2622553 RepID=UPI00267338C7|nr:MULTISPECIES: Fe-S cluster assembly protein SufD [unclassified Thermosynechococcus]MDR7898513.1 Fe-S cluster assembly protein SufD [Thermosynechococcus sp. JY1332]MDR7905915.1 Fe-S cluster assembly protein SufD [Thermosynechococcus sp. JY1334]WKT85649.1 Fe-S cluster assembly protein SufD [Thermosynechococcus sp. JY1339]WNC54592.1 Fe-S cluster assembly protein SufD [Thermosynechococcus sp. JY1331]
MTITVNANSDQADLPKASRTNELNDLLNCAPPPRHAELESLRQAARDRLHEQTLPSPRDEDWRFTDLSILRTRSFQGAIAPPSPEIVAEVRHLLCERNFATVAQIVLIDGYFSAELSRLNAVGVEQLPPLAPAIAPPEVFSDLNAAMLADRVCLRLSGALPEPVEVFFVSSRQQRSVVSPRLTVEVAAQGQATLIERFLSLTGDQQFTNSVTELSLGASARLRHVRIQHQSPTAIHIGCTAVCQAQDSDYEGHAVDLGGCLSRHNWQVQIQGSGSQTILKGLAIAMDSQIMDTHSAVFFNAPHSGSEQIHKCILGDRAHGIFNGRIVVPQVAQLTDASQLNRTLLLSDKARIDTKPQLEIVADNVKCSHGATVSQLASEDLFYLRSRGLEVSQAHDLLVKAFALEQLADLQPEPLQQEVEAALLAKLH